MTVTLNAVHRVADSFDRSFARQSEAFRRSHPNCTIALSSWDLPAYHRKMFAEGGLTNGEVDVFQCVTDWLPEAIERGGLVPLNDYIAENPPEGWPDAWPASLRGLQQDAGRKVYGLPHHDGPECLIYRADLLADERERTHFASTYGYDLRPPETWSQFLDIAQHFNRPDEELYGCVVAAYPDSHNSVYDFLIHLWSRGGEFLDGCHRVEFDSLAGRQALQWYVDLIHLHRVTQPDPWEHESGASGRIFASGRAAMMWNWFGFAAVGELPATSAISQNVRVAPLPKGDGPSGTRVSLNIYWTLTIPIGSRHPELAYAFCRHVVGPAMDRITTFEGGIGCRRSTWRDPEVLRRFPNYAALDVLHRHARTLPTIPEIGEVLGVLNEMVDDAVRLRKPVYLALRHAAGHAGEILAMAGYYD